MINSKRKGNEIEREVIGVINAYLEGARFVSMRGSGAFMPGDISAQLDPRKPLSPQWAKEWLKEHEGEIKGTKKPKLHEFVNQCLEQFQNPSNWVIYYRCPASWGIPDNCLAIQPIQKFLLEQKELIRIRHV